MKAKKFLVSILASLMIASALVGCSQTATNTTQATTGANGELKEGEYQYVSPDDTLKATNVHVLDVRTKENYEKGTVLNSEWCPIFPLEDDSLVEKMEAYAKNNLNDGKEIYIICNSGKRGAEKATGVLRDAGIKSTLIYTVEGGAAALQKISGALKPVEAGKVEEVKKRTVYVTPSWLKSAMDGNVSGYENVVVAEVAYGDVKDCKSYNEGHIVGAQYVDVCEVEDATGSKEGAYNLLAANVVEENILKHGINKDTKVVLYGQDAPGVGRVAYAYIWLGVEDVKILNGGIDAWKKAGYDTETKVNVGTATQSFGAQVPVNKKYYTTIDDAKERLSNDSNFKLVSIRSEGEWLGETSGYNYMDKAGEPEGAVWGKGAKTAFDVAEFTNEDGTIKNLDGFKEIWKDSDFTLNNHLSFYCGTGWRATVPFLVLYENGYDDISVYDGGWYQWLMDDSNKVQVGDPKSENCIHTTVGELPTGKAAK